MSNSIKVSVLTSLYNHKAEYVRKCLESLLSQKWQECEFILIDNGADANNKALIEEFLAKDKRFRVIRIENNEGYGKAINAGINSARGQYLGILESDDFVAKNIYNNLYKIAKTKKCDVVKCDWVSYYEKQPEKNLRKFNFPKELCGKIISPVDYPKLFTADPAIWTALYDINFIKQNNLFLSESPTGQYQDTSFNFKVFALATRVYLLDKAYVHYRRDNTNSSVRDRSAIFAISEQYHEIERFLNDHEDLRKKLVYVKNYNKSRTYRWNYGRAMGENKEVFYKEYKQDFKNSFDNREIDRRYFNDEEIDYLAKIINVPNIGHYCNDNLNICFSFDANYFNQALVAISSLIDKSSCKVGYNFYLIVKQDVDIHMKNEMRSFIQKMSPLSHVAYIKQDNIFENGYETRGVSNSTYYRLMLHRILPDVDYIIYSDVDVLFNTDLTELKSINLSDYAVAAVKDICVNQKQCWDMLTKKFSYFNQLLSGMCGEYRNAGFLILNLNKIRELNWDADVLKYSQMKLFFQDQDILNILIFNNKLSVYHLPPRYIYMIKHWDLGNYDKAVKENVITEQEYKETKGSPAIYHYAGPAKPWLCPNEPYNEAWVRYVKRHKVFKEKFFKSPIRRFLREIFYKKTLHNGYTMRRVFLGLISTKKKNGYLKLRLLGMPLFMRKRPSKMEHDIRVLGIHISKKVHTKDNIHIRYTLSGLFKYTKKPFTKKWYLMGIPIIAHKENKGSKRLSILGLPIHKTYNLAEQMATLQQQIRIANANIANLKCIIEAQTLHPKTFGAYKNAFNGKDVVLVCTGPTAQSYKMIPGAIHVGVNGAIYLDNVSLDYLFMQDYTSKQRDNSEMNLHALQYKGNNCKKFLGIIPDCRLTAVKRMSIGRIPLHYAYEDNASQYLLEDIFMHNIAYDLTREPLGDFGGTVFTALQFILFTNPKRLYLVGWDCGNAHAYKTNVKINAAMQAKICERYFIPHLRTYYPDIEVVSINPIGLKGMFQDVYTKAYIEKHPEIDLKNVEIIDIP